MSHIMVASTGTPNECLRYRERFSPDAHDVDRPFSKRRHNTADLLQFFWEPVWQVVNKLKHVPGGQSEKIA
jgi:hypothetical protein